MTKETRSFQTEVKQILDIMVHSLYSQREVFLRELVSNASDALSKRRFAELKDTSLSSKEEKHVRLTVDKEKNTLSILDNGIGMSYDEVVKNIGTIAYSGSKEFLQKAQKMKENPELIGQFGVGFYSAFMVADKVVIHTQRAGSDEGVVWESTGDGGYSIDKTARTEGTGTTITLHLKKKDEKDESFQDFTEEWVLRSLVKKYSDFVEFPIKMETTREEPELDKDGKAIEGKTKTVIEDQTFNTQKALWRRPASEVKAEEYNEFYKHISMDWTDPLDKIHYKAEGTQEFSALMYIPSNVPMDYYQRNIKWGLNLYVKKIFIADNCDQLVPSFLRFMKGVVDSSDLPLNISREMIQKDRRILGIQKAITSKILRHFKTMLEGNRELYEKFWEKFGATLKEGLASDFQYKDDLQELVLFHSSETGKRTTLKEYVARMKAEQKEIYYITGESLDIVKSSPYLEKLKTKGYEVLFMIDPVDEWVSQSITKYDEKELKSITREDFNIDSEEDKKKEEEKLKSSQEKFKALTDFMKDTLKEQVKDIKISTRLVDSPVCLVSGTNDPTAHMERMMEAMGQKSPKSKRILEINPDHPVITKLSSLSDERKKLWSDVLYTQALMNEGTTIPDPADFSKKITDIMVNN